LHRKFFAANRSVYKRISRRPPQARVSIFALYEETVDRLMAPMRGATVADVGGGKSCPFARYRRPGSGTRIVAVDISDEEMRHNRDVDEKRAANILKELPFEDGEADMVVSRSVLGASRGP
jgi:ubiquinone/menaquinone biosynthesis C-methylase UbiE